MQLTFDNSYVNWNMPMLCYKIQDYLSWRGPPSWAIALETNTEQHNIIKHKTNEVTQTIEQETAIKP